LTKVVLYDIVIRSLKYAEVVVWTVIEEEILQHPNTGYAAEGEGGHQDSASAETRRQQQPQGSQSFGFREPSIELAR